MSGTASNFGAQRTDAGLDRFAQRPASSGGISASGDGEDIKSKLARYKREREELEQVRQQLRAKNQNAVARASPGASAMRMNSTVDEQNVNVGQQMFEQATAN